MNWTRPGPGVYAVQVERPDAKTKLEWVHRLILARRWRALREVLGEAEAFVGRMPTEKAGLLFLKDGHVVQPDPDGLERYQGHAGRNRGHWPGSPEIAAAMFENYHKKADATNPKPLSFSNLQS